MAMRDWRVALPCRLRQQQQRMQTATRVRPRMRAAAAVWAWQAHKEVRQAEAKMRSSATGKDEIPCPDISLLQLEEIRKCGHTLYDSAPTRLIHRLTTSPTTTATTDTPRLACTQFPISRWDTSTLNKCFLFFLGGVICQCERGEYIEI